MNTQNCWGTNQIMVTAAVRYCIGRKTYIVSDCVEWVLDNWDNFTESTQGIIRKDIETELVRDNYARLNGDTFLPLGHDCDRAQWERLRGLWTINKTNIN